MIIPSAEKPSNVHFWSFQGILFFDKILLFFVEKIFEEKNFAEGEHFFQLVNNLGMGFGQIQKKTIIRAEKVRAVSKTVCFLHTTLSNGRYGSEVVCAQI